MQESSPIGKRQAYSLDRPLEAAAAPASAESAITLYAACSSGEAGPVHKRSLSLGFDFTLSQNPIRTPSENVPPAGSVET